MALTTLVCESLIPLLKPGSRVAAMGYPDIVAPESRVDTWLGRKVCDYRQDAEKICKWHGMKPQRIPDAKSFFGAFGAHLDVFDIVQVRGDEILCDLNYPINDAGAYDFVLDVGTMEHCFNIGQAALNMAGLLGVGGIIFHGNPFFMPNHGFYSLNPTFFSDFYRQSGFELMWCKLLPKGGIDPVDAPLTERFIFDKPQEMNIFAAARRLELKEILFPIQTKYRAA